VISDLTTLSRDDGEELTLPTSDFKSIMEEYEAFLNAPWKK
jgi:hypothetical protein